MAVYDQVMYEIYREEGYGKKVRVVYYTLLEEHQRDIEITRAMAGEHIYDGFFPAHRQADAQPAIEAVVARIDAGESLTEPQIDELLDPYAPPTDAEPTSGSG
ncbi:MAG: hypothetical protein IH988_11400 [Planctomycetes bacterium]|nr:hypothetical protein [Planctomycetota bacterium]